MCQSTFKEQCLLPVSQKTFALYLWAQGNFLQLLLGAKHSLRMVTPTPKSLMPNNSGPQCYYSASGNIVAVVEGIELCALINSGSLVCIVSENCATLIQP